MKKWISLSATMLLATPFFVNAYAVPNYVQDGLFLGIGAGYNSIDLTQNSWGKGIGNVITSTGTNSNGIAEGTGAPFKNNSQVISPTIQIGYLHHFSNPEYLYGFKFTYQYLGATATNQNLYIPQIGTMTSITGTTSPLFGYVNGTSIQVSTSHELSLLAFIGQSFGNNYVYLGVGPALFNMKSKNYYSIGYAEFDGITANLTGLVSYSSPSVWLFGGAAQLGMTCFISPTWFVDLSYNYAITGSTTVNHHQTYANSSIIGTTAYSSSGNLFTKDTLRVNNQSIRLTINKQFDFY